MANQAASLINPNAPALHRVRALMALMLSLIVNPDRAAELERLFAEAEQLLAHHLFEMAIALSGRADLRATHEPVLEWRGSLLRFGFRLKPGAMHPHHRIMLSCWRAAAIDRYRRALARRSRFSRKLSVLHFRNQRRRQGVIVQRRRAGAQFPLHTPSRIAAPP